MVGRISRTSGCHEASRLWFGGVLGTMEVVS